MRRRTNDFTFFRTRSTRASRAGLRHLVYACKPFRKVPVVLKLTGGKIPDWVTA